jgi:hypothetical protein
MIWLINANNWHYGFMETIIADYDDIGVIERCRRN